MSSSIGPLLTQLYGNNLAWLGHSELTKYIKMAANQQKDNSKMGSNRTCDNQFSDAYSLIYVSNISLGQNVLNNTLFQEQSPNMSTNKRRQQHAVTSWHGKTFRITGPLWGDSNDKVSTQSINSVELCFLHCYPAHTVGMVAIWDVITTMWRHCSENIMNKAQLTTPCFENV